MIRKARWSTGCAPGGNAVERSDGCTLFDEPFPILVFFIFLAMIDYLDPLVYLPITVGLAPGELLYSLMITGDIPGARAAPYSRITVPP